MTQSSIPMAIPVPEPENDLRNIQSVINNHFNVIRKDLKTILSNLPQDTISKLSDTTNSLDKIKNKLELQSSVYDYKVSNFLNNIDKFNTRMDQLQTSIDLINKNIKPITKLAEGTIVANEIKANTEQKESQFKNELELAKLRAINDKTSVWVALEKNKNDQYKKEKEKKDNSKFSEGLIVGSVGMFTIAGVIFGMNSKL